MARRRGAVFAAAALGCVISALLSLCLGAAALSPAQLWRAALSGPNDTAGYIFWFSRLPRTCAGLFSGAALSCAGCVMQAVLGNKLASPSVVGVNAGAGLGVTLCCAAGLLSGWAVAGASFAGALAAAGGVVLLARRTGASRTTVILSGVALNSILNALRDAVTLLSPEAAMLSGEFRVGGFSAVTSTRLFPAAALIALALAAVMTLGNDLDVLALGEETAASLGMRVRRKRAVFLLLAALLAGAAVSFSGLLGFVGLLVPHMARRFVGAQSRFALPLSALMGAGFVTLCDLAARLLFAPYELPVGILMAVLGGPFFLTLLFREKGGHRNA
ncbi:MAG TPA: iron ABC transporter permease [Candidatus Pullichristensenella avicola]|nr:iron ABC transporter permease [Candidatus Pullichristensenella avicola]